jgi:hypothetical protein
LASSISSFLSSPDSTFEYDFGLLSVSVTLVYSYGIALPILVWIALRYMGVGEWSVVEAVAVWGYAMFVWIPVSVRLVEIYECGLLMCVLVDPMRDTCASSALGARWCSLCTVRVLLDRECVPHSRICVLFYSLHRYIRLRSLLWHRLKLNPCV